MFPKKAKYRICKAYNVQYSKQRPTAESLHSDTCLCFDEMGHIEQASLVREDNGLWKTAKKGEWQQS